MLRGWEKRLLREHNERAWHAWHIAALSRMKKLPDLKKLMARDRTVRKLQTPDQQEAIFMAMAEASKVLRKN